MIRKAFSIIIALRHRDGQERIPISPWGWICGKFLHLYIVPGQGKVYVTAAHEEIAPEN